MINKQEKFKMSPKWFYNIAAIVLVGLSTSRYIIKEGSIKSIKIVIYALAGCVMQYPLAVLADANLANTFDAAMTGVDNTVAKQKAYQNDAGYTCSLNSATFSVIGGMNLYGRIQDLKLVAAATDKTAGKFTDGTLILTVPMGSTGAANEVFAISGTTCVYDIDKTNSKWISTTGKRNLNHIFWTLNTEKSTGNSLEGYCPGLGDSNSDHIKFRSFSEYSITQPILMAAAKSVSEFETLRITDDTLTYNNAITPVVTQGHCVKQP